MQIVRKSSTKIVGHVDSPANGTTVQRHGFHIDGWAYLHSIERRCIEASVDGVVIGSTKLSYSRMDVVEALKRPDAEFSGFSIGCILPEQMRDRESISVRVSVIDADGDALFIGETILRVSAQDYRLHGHGDILRDGMTRVMQRDNVYGSGPPSPVADGRVMMLVRRYLRKTDRIVDVGCGIGAFGRILGPEGYDWTGCEVRPDFCDIVRAQGLRAATVVGNSLPFDDGAFDSALCIEVLEHIADYSAFVAEIRRIVQRRAVFSVPNFESIPVMSAKYALPWHMLESDHKSFFTRQSLAATLQVSFANVEVFEYGALPSFVTEDGLPVFNHLFAIADVNV